MGEGMEIYPMPMFPTLAVRDVGASVRWYAEKVGFGTVIVMPGADGEPVLGHLRWRKYADVLLVPDAGRTGRDQTGRVWECRLSFLVGDANVDAMAERLAGLTGLRVGGRAGDAGVEYAGDRGGGSGWVSAGVL